ncbi:hypothetical protein P20480_2360 [Pseudoalteromonas sp. BSi20480]|nr:hypothetical protein P20480_2360 [Pseudoalteromonas sp. BSi20480]
MTFDPPPTFLLTQKQALSQMHLSSGVANVCKWHSAVT